MDLDPPNRPAGKGGQQRRPKGNRENLGRRGQAVRSRKLNSHIDSAPLALLERYALIAYPVDNGWEIYDCDEALQQRDPLSKAPKLVEAIRGAVERLEGWIG